MNQIRPNAFGLIAIFVALGGTAWAVDRVDSSDIARNAVKSKHILNGQVKGADLRANSVGAAAVADESLGGSDVADNALGGADINEGDLGRVPNASSASSADLAASVAPGAVGAAEMASSIPAVRGTQSGSQVITRNVSSVVNFNGPDEFDTRAMHDPAGANSRFTAPVAGIYEITATVGWPPDGTGTDRLVILFKNGSAPLDSDSSPPLTGPAAVVQQQATSTVRLATGDFVEAQVFHDANADLNILASTMTMTWLAPGP